MQVARIEYCTHFSTPNIAHCVLLCCATCAVADLTCGNYDFRYDIQSMTCFYSNSTNLTLFQYTHAMLTFVSCVL